MCDVTFTEVENRPGESRPARLREEELARLGMPKEIPMRHRSTQFAHIFSSEGYAAGYYDYPWADVLTSDAAGVSC